MQRYKPLNSTKIPDPKRPRRSVEGSRLPKWLARRPLVQKFMRLSRRRKIVLVVWVGISILVLLALITTILFANSLGSKERIMNRNKTGVTLLDRKGRPFYQFYDARSDTHIALGKIAVHAQQAAISAEDKDFYDHPGFSPRGIINAIWQNIRPGGLNSGGSTITQQLVASALLSKERSLIRKYQELVLSIEIERRYSKDEILEMYLNSVYFGEGAFGIEDASRVYFNKPASKLNLAESSMLLGLLPAPSVFSPLSGDPEKAASRQEYVLNRMVANGQITEEQATAAKKQRLSFNTQQEQQDFKAPHFALMAKQELEEKYGEEKIARSGYRVTTSLDLDWQKAAETAVADQVAALEYSNVSNGAAVVIDPKTGAIRALVGSKNWYDKKLGKFNIATATRQPGSSFKPIVYATGIENRDFTAATLWRDQATDFGGGYRPNNYDLTFRGNVTTRRALSISLNIPAVAALQKTGIDKTISQAKKLGITTLDDDANYGLSMALGSAPANLTEMTNAYATFADQGKFKDSTAIYAISDKNNSQIFKHSVKTKQAISEQTSFIISSMLSDPVARSEVFGSSLNLADGRLAAVKTGTTENYRDAWTIGYTPSIVVGVWIGNNDNSEMSTIAGSSGAAPIWRNIMQEVLLGSDHQQFTVPSGLTSRSICRNNGALAQTSGGNTLTEYFIPGTLPTTTCNQRKTRPQQPAAPTRPSELDTEDEEPEEEEPIDPENPEDPDTETPDPDSPLPPILNP